jgi:hypothetical protein
MSGPTKTPTTPEEAYKAIIDQFANDTRLRGGGTQVKAKGIYSKAPAHQRYNDFIQSLTTEQKNLLSDMLKHEREAAIHDLLSDLTWWMVCREVGLTFRGQPMPTELAGEGLHGDFISRTMGYPWP